jgi:hypothetical protein
LPFLLIIERLVAHLNLVDLSAQLSYNSLEVLLNLCPFSPFHPQDAIELVYLLGMPLIHHPELPQLVEINLLRLLNLFHILFSLPQEQFNSLQVSALHQLQLEKAESHLRPDLHGDSKHPRTLLVLKAILGC